MQRLLQDCRPSGTLVLRSLAGGLATQPCSLVSLLGFQRPGGRVDRQEEAACTSGRCLDCGAGARYIATSAAQQPASEQAPAPRPVQQQRMQPGPVQRGQPDGRDRPQSNSAPFQSQDQRPFPAQASSEGFAQFDTRNRQLTNLKQRQVGVISVQSTSNNTIITLADTQGRAQAWASAGTLGFTNSRKKTTHAAEAVAGHMADKARALGFTTVEVHVKGMGYGKQRAVKVLTDAGLRVTAIHENTPIPHNGCRMPRKRRV